MDLKILLLYASARGSTKEVAEHISVRLREADPPLGAVTTAPFTSPPTAEELQNFDAIIIGSAVYNVSWLPTATSFLSAQMPVPPSSLATNDTASATVMGNRENHSSRVSSLHPRLGIYAFSVGSPRALPKLLRQSSMIIHEEQNIWSKLENTYGLKDILKGRMFFMGVAPEDGIQWGFRTVWTWVGGKFGDLREWDKIESWTDGIMKDLRNGGGREVEI